MNKELLLEDRKLIAGFLKNRREEMGISVQELADLCGVNKTTIYRIEQSKFMPHGDLLLILTHHLNCYFYLAEKEGNSHDAVWMRERWGR